MSVKKDPSGQRYVEVEAEVPGTPEEVWEAIATGRGVSSWFVPATMEEKKGGAVTLNFGPGMDSHATITSWEPPHRFIAVSPEGAMGPNSPTVADEWTVEARSGGTCIVRVVHRWFSDTDDWDHQFEGIENGWPAFFRILRLYLTHFRGMPSSAFQLLGFSPESETGAWASLSGLLGIEEAAVGRRVRTTAAAPPIAGVVERVGERDHPELLLRLEEPAPGVGHLFAMSMGGQVCLSMRCYLYGGRAAAVVARDEPSWQAWMQEHFPAAMNSGTTG
jgi:uncharacterized protein YndB with AHSA1/START domain